MTADGTTDPLYCYRHPGRETYVSCGRCERPICTQCAMQGPVGLRCRECGKPGHDPLATLSTAQLAAGTAVALGAGTLAGFVGLRLGFLLSICIGPFVGGLIGEGVMRATGYKRGPIIRLLVAGGIVAGLLLAATVDFAVILPVGAGAVEAGLGGYLVVALTSGVIYVAAALIGAFARLR